MRFGELDIDDALIEAQREGNLAIFAGAGVSAGPPSSLPGFEELIERLERWSGVPRKRVVEDNGGQNEKSDQVDESFENYLGRLEDRSLAFREKVREFLAKDGSEPTPLHRHILRLFDQPSNRSAHSNVRIVTTNFDRHFSRAAKDVFDEPVDEYKAPALPLGNDFSGIVYLHGSLDQANRRLVLSDSDFSRAYLTEGWARRFVQQLFSQYVVLFVGYGHGDDVMRYLARGIPPDAEQGRFAFEKNWGQRTDWAYFGVNVARYPAADGDNSHAELTRAIDEWVKYAVELPSEHEARIQNLVGESPDKLTPHQEEFLLDVLQRDDRIHFFTRHATSFEWIEWVEDKGFLDPLFRPESLTENQRHLVRWFVDRISDHPGRLFALASSAYGRWNPTLIRDLAFELYRLWSDKALSSSTTLAWVMAATQEMSRVYDPLPTMLSRCQYPDDVELATHLFRFLTRPHVEMRESYGLLEGGGVQTWIDVGFNEKHGTPYQTALREGWDAVFAEHLDALANVVEPIVSDRLRAFHEVYAAGEESSWAVWDPFVDRWEEGPSRYRGGSDEIDVLTAAAKDLITWALDEDPETASYLIRKWSRSEVPILEALAVYGVRGDNRSGADEKIQWVLERDWLLARRAAGEPERLVAEEYSGSSTALRERLHTYIEQQRVAFAEGDKHYRLRRIQDMLADFLESTPDCELAQEAYTQFGAEHANLAHELGAANPEEEPIGLASFDPEDDLQEIVSMFDEQADLRRRRDAENTLEGILRADVWWGVRLAEALAEVEAWAAKAWFFLLRVLRRIELEDAAWARFLDLFAQLVPLHDHYADEIIHFVTFQVDRHKANIPETSVDQAVQLIDALRPKVAHLSIKNERVRLSNALAFHAYAEAVKFYCDVFVRQGEQGSLPEAFQERVQALIAEDLPDSARQARSFALARCAARLLDLDAEWTRRTILPIFSWNDVKSAAAAWTGVVAPGCLSGALMAELEDAFRETFQHLDHLDREGQDRFVKAVSDACLSGAIDPAHNGWLITFSRNADRDQRIKWVQRVRGRLYRGIGDEQIREIWFNWMEEYWRQRNQGIPVPFDPVELKEMARWIPHLGSCYPLAVEMLLEGERDMSLSTPFDILYFVKDKELASQYPRATFDLLSSILDRAESGSTLGLYNTREILPSLAESEEIGMNELDSLFERAIELNIIEHAH